MLARRLGLRLAPLRPGPSLVAHGLPVCWSLLGAYPAQGRRNGHVPGDRARVPAPGSRPPSPRPPSHRGRRRGVSLIAAARFIPRGRSAMMIGAGARPDPPRRVLAAEAVGAAL